MADTLPSRSHTQFSNLLRLPTSLLTQAYCYLTTPPTFENTDELLLLDSSRPCAFRTDNDTSATVTLPDGRKLGYAEYGLASGRAVICLHGLPGARTEAAMWDQIARDAGARLISVDRPGIGWSSPQSNRRLLDLPKDLQHLAEHLKLDEYAVMGSSAGGPYAFACAYAMPKDKLKAVAVVIGLGSPEMHGWKNYLGWWCCRYTPWLPQWFFSRDPAARLDLADEERFKLIREDALRTVKVPKDREGLKQVDVLRLFVERTSREIFRQGTEGLVKDAAVLGMDWQFEVQNIREDLPIQLWYGKQDTVSPASWGEQYAARLKGRATLRVEDETHGSMIRNFEPEILKTLVSSW